MSRAIQQQLLEAIQKIDRPGTFCASGRVPAMLPGLEVVGVGPIALPLEKRQAAALKKRARQAPYGKGTQTLVDTDVRRVWEVDADQVALTNPEWPGILDHVVERVRTELGLEKQKVDAHLYKLLLYEPGSFFLAHRDGEKLDRMVATLVVALPSVHSGGELVVRHEGRENVVDFGRESQFHVQYAAFYADCEHEIRPVKSGFRLSLVYNLTLAKSKRGLAAPRSSAHIDRITGILQQWKEEGQPQPGEGERSEPDKLAILLDHKYSKAGLEFDTLKGVDRARAEVMFAAARQAGCDAYLALVTFWQTGAAESTGGDGYGRYRRYEDEDEGEYEMGEVFDNSLTAEQFSDADGNSLSIGAIPVDEGQIVSETPLGDGEPDEEDFEGYTGNAGMTLERWYHRAAVLIWPAESRFDVLCDAGVKNAVGGLQQMVLQWRRAKKSEQALLREQCLAFARRIIARWPEQQFAGWSPGGGFASYPHEEFFGKGQSYDDDFEDEDLDEDEDFEGDLDEAGGPGEKASKNDLFISLLKELGDASLVADWIRGVLARDASVDPGSILGDVCQKLGWRKFENELTKLFENTSNETIQRNARLLADFSLRKDNDADRKGLCAQLGQLIMSFLEHWDPRAKKSNWQARSVNLTELLPPLVQSFVASEENKLLDRLTTYILDRPREFDVTTVQVPALLQMQAWLKRNVKQPFPPLHRWLAAVVKELQFRAAHPPQEPTDWRRESDTGCKCADCKSLSAFLGDPNTEMLRLPLAKDRRQHMHQVIDRTKLDATHATERRGSPYTLVFTKTKASYERALAAHHVDLQHLAKIGKLLEWHRGLKKGSATGTMVAKKRPRRK